MRADDLANRAVDDPSRCQWGATDEQYTIEHVRVVVRPDSDSDSEDYWY